MKKAFKTILCTFSIMAIMACNVFAAWSEETPNFGTIIDLAYTENITSPDSFNKLTECLDNAYDIGLFGGAVPFACTTETIDTEYGTVNIILVLCAIPYMDTGESGLTYAKSEVYGYIVEFGPDSYGIQTQYENGIATYYLLSTGDVWDGASNDSVSTLGDNERILCMKINTVNGPTWWANPNDPLYAQYYNTDNSVNQVLVNINEKYERALEPEPTPPPVIVSYSLDIPAIITAIPNGAKQIINNTFGFEIFGINVAGLLSVVLVVAIVAFVVKWLMTR